MKRNRVAAVENKLVVRNGSRSKARKLYARTTFIRNRNFVFGDRRLNGRMVYIDSARVTAYFIILNIKLVSAPALSEDGVRVAVARIIRAVEHALTYFIGHLARVVEVIVNVKPAAENTIGDNHFRAENFFFRISRSVRRRSSDGGGSSACKFDIFYFKRSADSEHIVVTAGNVSLNVSVRYPCFIAVFIAYAEDRVARSRYLVVSADRAVDIVSVRLQRSEARHFAVNKIFNFGNRTAYARVFAKRSGVIRNVEISFIPGHAV